MYVCMYVCMYVRTYNMFIFYSLNALAELAREKHFQDALMDRLG